MYHKMNTMDNKTQIRHYHQPYFFYFLSILIPWVLWFSVAYISHAYPNDYVALIGVGGFLGLLAPLLVALAFIIPNETLKKDFFGRVFNLRKVSHKYISLAFLLMPFSILTAQLISLFLGYSIEQFQFRGGFTFTSDIFPVWVLLIIAPLIEELAWHSYGTDCLRNRFSLLKTSLLFALFFGLWHLPLAFIKDYYHSNLVESGPIYALNFFVSLFPFVLIMNWLYYKSNRNILITIVFHISAGYFNEIFATDPMSKVIQTGLLILFSIYIIINDKAFFINQ
mgnify:CR=1 FL=1